jgi:hypothetical protein
MKCSRAARHGSGRFPLHQRADSRASQTLSGRAAQLDATQRTLEQDLGFVKAEIERLQVAAKAAARSAGQQARREPAPPPLPNAPWLSPRLAGLSLRLLRRIRCLRSHPAASQACARCEP